MKKEVADEVRSSLAELMCVLVANWQDVNCKDERHTRGLVTIQWATRGARENPDGQECGTESQSRSLLRHPASRYLVAEQPLLLPLPSAQVEGVAKG